LLVVGVVALWTTFYTVPAESEGVVLRFGRFSHIVPPGLHFKVPLGVDDVNVVPVKRQLKQEFGFGTDNSSNPWQASPESSWLGERTMVTGDLNVALVEWVVQYRIERADQYLVVLLVLFTMTGSYYAVQETEQVIITQFGKPSANAVTQAGLHFKLPFIQEVHVINKQILEWDGAKSEMPTRDKLYISVDTFARWRITRPLEYFRRLRDERSAQSRLDDILGSETRNAIAKHDLIEVIRTTKDRKPETDMAAIDAGTSNIGVLPPIKKGRKEIEREIQDAATAKLSEFGIELLDVRFKRINYNPSVVEKIYERMISERQQIASRFRSEGEGEAAKILGNKERDLSVIESGAYKTVGDSRCGGRHGHEHLRSGVSDDGGGPRPVRVRQNHGDLRQDHRRRRHAGVLDPRGSFPIFDGCLGSALAEGGGAVGRQSDERANGPHDFRGGPHGGIGSRVSRQAPARVTDRWLLGRRGRSFHGRVRRR
jgi:membrane protease subunit HflC